MVYRSAREQVQCLGEARGSGRRPNMYERSVKTWLKRGGILNVSRTFCTGAKNRTPTIFLPVVPASRTRKVNAYSDGRIRRSYFEHRDCLNNQVV